MIIFWLFVFVAALALLVKSADWLLASAEKIGLALGLSPFILGVLIVGFGTSLPEIASSMAAAVRGVTEIVSANAIGSNIANILLVIGLSAVVGGRLVVTKNLIDLDIPLLAVSTVLFLAVAQDKLITPIESLLLLFGFAVYLAYILGYDEKEDEEADDTRSNRSHVRQSAALKSKKMSNLHFEVKDLFFLVLGSAGLFFSAKYLIDAVLVMADFFAVDAGIISLVAVAVGTSLPELMVSVKAAWEKKSEVALGNIFGSNVINILLVIGIPGLFRSLTIDEQTYTMGIPMFIVATALFIISGISRRIHVYEGAMYLVIYLLFIGKLFNLV